MPRKIIIVMLLSVAWLACKNNPKKIQTRATGVNLPWPMPTFHNMDNMAIEAVIQLAPTHIIKFAYRGGAQVDLDSANTAVRFAFYEQHLGPKWSERMYAAQMGKEYADNCPYQPELFTGWRTHALNIARNALKSPDRLKRTYQRHKAMVLAAIRGSGLGPRTKAYLQRIAPLFDGRPPNAELLAARQAYKVAIKDNSAAYDKYTEVGRSYKTKTSLLIHLYLIKKVLFMYIKS